MTPEHAQKLCKEAEAMYHELMFPLIARMDAGHWLGLGPLFSKVRDMPGTIRQFDSATVSTLAAFAVFGWLEANRRFLSPNPTEAHDGTPP